MSAKSWFVPGKTAARRIDRWLAQEAEMLATHGDSKGRDAFAFDPISSPYLEVSDDLRVRTPYSKIDSRGTAGSSVGRLG